MLNTGVVHFRCMVSLCIKEHALFIPTVLAINKTEVSAGIVRYLLVIYSQGGNALFPGWECFVPTVGIIFALLGNIWGACFADNESRILNHLATQFIEGSRAKMQQGVNMIVVEQRLAQTLEGREEHP